MFKTVWKYGFTVLTIVATLLLVAGLVVYCIIPRTSQSSRTNINWLNYISHNSNIAFDYPEGWTVNDHKITEPFSELGTTSITYDILYICPPQQQLILSNNDNGRAANCISFYFKNQILNPGLGFEDVRTMFTRLFGKYIGNPQYIGLRVLQSSNNPHVQPANNINLIGLYNTDQDSPIAMYQSLCTEGKALECLSTFQHVLESLRAFP